MRLSIFKRSRNFFSIRPNRFLQEVCTQQEILSLQSHFKELLKVLRDNHLENLPWYILIGPEEAGKTTLLTHSFHAWKYTVPSVFALRSSKITASTQRLLHPICARINTEGVFIEIPGRFLQEQTRAGIWEAFLKLLKKNKVYPLLRAVILVLDLNNLAKLSTQKHQEQIYLFKHHFSTLTQILKHPIYLQILLSKVDTLLGFNEFFSESLQEERSDVFGIEFSKNAFNTIIPASHVFSEQFAVLLTKLNERIIWLLHRERLIYKKSLIADFPQQFASFKELLHRYIYDLVDMAPYQNKILFKSIYFFSNLSNGDTEDHLAKLLAVYQLPERENHSEASKSKSYFVNRLLNKTSQLSQVPKAEARALFAIPRHITFLTISLSTLLFLGYLGIDFQRKTQAIDQLQKNFSEVFHQNFSDDSNQTLFNEAQSLEYLQSVISLLKAMPLSWLIDFEWHPLHKLQIQTTQEYQQILQHQFIPSLKNALTNDLLRASIADSNRIYALLKAYLALKNPQRNADYLSSWLKSYLSDQKIKEVLHIPFNERGINVANWPATEIDDAAVSHARNLLTSLPKPLLAYLVLKGEMAKTINPFPQDFDKVFVSPQKTRLISAIYTQKEIASTYFHQIPRAVQAALFGNNVLGKQVADRPSEREIQSTINEVRAFYLMDYAHRWQYILSNTEVKLARDYWQALAILDGLTNKPDLLATLLREVVQQTTIDVYKLSKYQPLSEQRRFQDDIKHYFKVDEATNQLINAKPHLIDDAIQPELSRLKSLLENIAKSADIKKTSFEFAKTEFQNQKLFGKLAATAFELPPPLSRWLITIVSNDWLLVLQHTHTHVHQAWQNTILAEYRSKLSDRYPLVKRSMNDIELADFAHFFGKEGTMEVFFNRYLQPFIDTTTPRWQWRELYGQSLSRSSDFPLQLERAALLRKMFFSKTGELTVEFYLMPEAIGPTLRSIQLNIDGQMVNSQLQNVNMMPLLWPGIKNREGSSLTFLKQNGERMLLSEKGPWSLFRLLDNAYVQATKDPKSFSLTFDLNGNAVKYQLAAESPLNPFVPNFIEQFNCPESF